MALSRTGLRLRDSSGRSEWTSAARVMVGQRSRHLSAAGESNEQGKDERRREGRDGGDIT